MVRWGSKRSSFDARRSKQKLSTIHEEDEDEPDVSTDEPRDSFNFLESSSDTDRACTPQPPGAGIWRWSPKNFNQAPLSDAGKNTDDTKHGEQRMFRRRNHSEEQLASDLACAQRCPGAIEQRIRWQQEKNDQKTTRTSSENGSARQVREKVHGNDSDVQNTPTTSISAEKKRFKLKQSTFRQERSDPTFGIEVSGSRIPVQTTKSRKAGMPFFKKIYVFVPNSNKAGLVSRIAGPGGNNLQRIVDKCETCRVWIVDGDGSDHFNGKGPLCVCLRSADEQDHQSALAFINDLVATVTKECDYPNDFPNVAKPVQRPGAQRPGGGRSLTELEGDDCYITRMSF